MATHRSQLVRLVGIAFLAGWAIVGFSAGRAAAFDPIAIAPTTSNVSGVPFLTTPPPEAISAIGSPTAGQAPSQPAIAPRTGIVSPTVALVALAVALPLVAVAFVLARRRSTQP